jgi:hypothetical protein
MIEKEWQSFRVACFGNISEQQYVDLRRTFYGGVSSLYFILMSSFDSGDEPTESDLQRMRELHNELHLFNDAVKAGEA